MLTITFRYSRHTGRTEINPCQRTTPLLVQEVVTKVLGTPENAMAAPIMHRENSPPGKRRHEEHRLHHSNSFPLVKFRQLSCFDTQMGILIIHQKASSPSIWPHNELGFISDSQPREIFPQQTFDNFCLSQLERWSG